MTDLFPGALPVLLMLFGLLVATSVWLRRRAVVMRLPARLDNIRSLVDLACDMARDARFSESDVFECRLALDEACANIINHSYANNPLGEIDVRIWIRRGALTIRLTDYGEPYDPDVVQQPYPSKALDERAPGGLGLFLIRQVMDEVRYRACSDGNALEMVKRCYASGVNDPSSQ